jgi:aldehyde:ferredoxin oxidoreductase
MGKILRVDLSRERTKIEDRDEIFYRRYVGGRALIANYLLKELEKGIDPLGSQNKLIFSSGVVTGAPISGSGRNSIGAKSPLTGGYGDGEVGGFWGAELKHAGWDAIIFEGKAKSPVYLWLKDHEAEIREASKLWGKDTGDTIEAIRKKHNDNLVRVSVIGRGGENLVRYACIMNGGKDAAGRCGLGAVMGSKNLKAVAVRGTGKVVPVNMSILTTLNRKLSKSLSGFWAHEYGTGGSMDAYALSGNLPYHNFRDGEFPHYNEISARALKEKGWRIGMEGCWACLVRCKKIVQIEDKEWVVNPYYGGPEYETIAALGSNCGVGNLKAICKASELCNRHSIDTISCGATIAFAMECFEKGLINEEDTGGHDLRFGNEESLLKLVDMIATRVGLGDLLAEGCKRAAEKIGGSAAKYAVHVKGQEVPMHDPRRKRGLRIGYALSSTGADHRHNLHYADTQSENGIAMLKAFGIVERPSFKDMGPQKVRLLLHWLNWQHMFDCLHMCEFIPWTPLEIVKITNAITGWGTSVLELAKLGERAINLTRIFNIREGFTVEDDTLPDRFYHPQSSGALSTTAVDKDNLVKSVKKYYGMMGWSSDGIPSREKLEELDIGWAYSYRT